MANERLRSAFNRAGLTSERAAHHAQVDPKTVQKWLAGRVPHPRHRWAVSELVGEDEEYLWPDARRQVVDGLGGVAEVLSAYPYRSKVDASRWRRLIENGERQIDLLGYTLYFLPELVHEIVELLQAKADAGCQVRIVMADPDCKQVRLRDEEELEPITIVARIHTSLRTYAPLLDQPNCDIRYQSAPLYNSIYRFDDEMFVTPHLYATPGHSAPLFHLRRLGPNGMFSRFASHFEAIWSDTEPIGQDRRRTPVRTGG
ncbi:MAG: XRE family transcriptional regulator [Nocardioides sp.]|nr:XRE family transcriptional regulator [Nocardioides sp.]